MSLLDSSQDYKGSRTLSKKKYFEILDALSKCYRDEDISKISGVIKEVMRFDPTVVDYTPERGRKITENRKKRAEELGVSTYITSGAKQYYERRKNLEKQK